VVGVNSFQVDEPVRMVAQRVDPRIEQDQRQRLAAVRARRDGRRAAELVAQLEQAARSQSNLMEPIIECVEADVTLGEICGALRRVWGEYRPPSPW
jgi:methylmalonyl-CoA mutase N-terminal domain/subunit